MLVAISFSYGDIRIVKHDLCLTDKSHITHEILAYLLEHPASQDTLEGIMQWWLLDRKIKYQMRLVEKALDDLVNQELVIKEKKMDSTNLYRVNNHKLGEIEGSIKKD
jgi:hypothetical protein